MMPMDFNETDLHETRAYFHDDMAYDADKECGSELAQAYVPFQHAKKIYPPETGLLKGTIFPELYRPYCACEASNRKRAECGCKKPNYY